MNPCEQRSHLSFIPTITASIRLAFWSVIFDFILTTLDSAVSLLSRLDPNKPDTT